MPEEEILQPDAPVEPTEQSAPDTDAPQAQPLQPGQGNFRLSPTDGLAVTVMSLPVTVSLPPEQMRMIAKMWVNSHPDLFEELVRERVEMIQMAQARVQPVTDTRTIRHINQGKLRAPGKKLQA